MVLCEYDTEVCGEILGWKLPPWQALLFGRVLPSFGGLIVYLLVICYDFALIFEHFKNGNRTLGLFSLLLMVLPALLSTIFSLASPAWGLQEDESKLSIKIQKKEVIWILTQILNLIFFPVATISRYMYLLFWWIEAVFASKKLDNERTKEAVARAREPTPLELYLFLQAFIHSAPLAVVNILDMMAHVTNPVFDKINIQAVSLVASSLRMASIATTYRRFEREKLCGRKYPWSYSLINNDTRVEETPKRDSPQNVDIPVTVRKPYSEQMRGYDREQYNSDFIQFSPRNSDEIRRSPMKFDKDASDTSSDYDLASIPNGSLQSDDEYVKPISIVDRVAPHRSYSQYTIEKVHIPPPPPDQAPRPGSLAVWAEKLVENAESIPHWLSAPPRRKYREVIQDEPDLPYRVPRSFMRGLEPQDVTAALVHFLAWYSFFIARLFSIAAFINFFPVLAIIILFSHYQVMLLFLIVPPASTIRRSFYVFLAFIYLFCLMEFKIRFRHVRAWHVFWIIVCSVEITVFILLWATFDNKLHYWWRTFVVLVTLGGMLLSYMMFLVYFLLLQPRETIVHINRQDRRSNKL